MILMVKRISGTSVVLIFNISLFIFHVNVNKDKSDSEDRLWVRVSLFRESVSLWAYGVALNTQTETYVQA